MKKKIPTKCVKEIKIYNNVFCSSFMLSQKKQKIDGVERLDERQLVSSHSESEDPDLSFLSEFSASLTPGNLHL